jgi:hypothetical protein
MADLVPRPSRDSAVAIALLFPNLLGTYGDGGNALVLQKRLQWRGIDARIVTVDAGEPAPDSCDLYLLGGGEDGPQTQAARELGTNGPHRAVASAVVFAVCAGMQIVGHHFPDNEGRTVTGLGLLDCETVRTDEPRAVGELLVQTDDRLPGLGRLTGFENHGGRTRLGPEATGLGPVAAGGVGKPPKVLDTTIAELAPLDDADREADLLRSDRFRAVEAGHLDGVASRTWKDRVLRRN